MISIEMFKVTNLVCPHLDSSGLLNVVGVNYHVFNKVEVPIMDTLNTTCPYLT
jgi:hypothetical protein